MKVDSTYFGRLTNGFQVEKYTLENRKGITVGLSSFGATITQLAMPDRNGRIENIGLGNNTVDGYGRDRHNLGGIISGSDEKNFIFSNLNKKNFLTTTVQGLLYRDIEIQFFAVNTFHRKPNLSCR